MQQEGKESKFWINQKKLWNRFHKRKLTHDNHSWLKMTVLTNVKYSKMLLQFPVRPNDHKSESCLSSYFPSMTFHHLKHALCQILQWLPSSPYTFTVLNRNQFCFALYFLIKLIYRILVIWSAKVQLTVWLPWFLQDVWTSSLSFQLLPILLLKYSVLGNN